MRLGSASTPHTPSHVWVVGSSWHVPHRQNGALLLLLLPLSLHVGLPIACCTDSVALLKLATYFQSHVFCT